MRPAIFLSSFVPLAIIFAIVFFPAFLWLLQGSLAERFVSFSATMASLGKIAGLTGMALFSIVVIFSAKFKFLDRLFSGLNRVFLYHHLLGTLAFSLLLAHPIFLALQYQSISVATSARFLLSADDWVVNLGKVALLIMIALLAITFYAKWRYETWKFSHQFLGLALFFASLHVFFIPSDVSSNPTLRLYMLGLAGLALAAFLWRTVFKLYRLGEYPYAVQAAWRASENVIAFELSPLAKPLPYLPGQFVFIRFQGKQFGDETHPFSITSERSSSKLSFAVKALGDFTSLLYFLEKDVQARIEGPFGTFTYSNARFKNQIWIAGGIGITPFLGMARDLAAQNRKDYQIQFFYSMRRESDAVFLEELLSASSVHPQLRVVPFYSDKQGLITATFIEELSNGLAEKDIFLCGPPAFMESLKKQFLKAGVLRHLIHTEEFRLRE